MPKLIVTRAGRSRVVPLGARALLIGSDARCDVRVDGAQSAPEQCRIEPLPDGDHLLVALGSGVGVQLNGHALAGRARIELFDCFQAGDATIVYVEDGVGAEDVPWTEPRLLDSSCDTLVDVDPPAGAADALASGRARLKERLLNLTLLGQNLTSEVDLARMLRAVLAEALEFTGLVQGLVLLEGPPGDAGLRAVIGHELEPRRLDRAELGPLLELGEAALSERRIVVRRRACSTELVELALPLNAPFRPQVHTDRRRSRPAERLGVMVLWGPSSLPLDPTDLRLLEAVAAQVAIVLRNTRLEQLATMDPLTQLANRRCLEERLAEEVELARSEGIPLAVLMVDLDHFKQINDTYGHQAGDEVLRLVARRLRRSVRADDLVGRYGGEEFLILLPGADVQGGSLVASKIARALAARPIGEAGLRVTASIGLAAFPFHARDAQRLVRRADQALYAAKVAGRNRVMVFDPIMGAAPDLPEYDGMGTIRAPRVAPEADLPLPERAPGEDPDDTRTDLMVSLPQRAERDVPLAWLCCGPLRPLALGPRDAVLVVGRGRECDLVLPHPMISRRHALIRIEGGAMWLEDQRSLNGVVHNDAPVKGRARLAVGDRVQIGPFRFDVRAALEPGSDAERAESA